MSEPSTAPAPVTSTGGRRTEAEMLSDERRSGIGLFVRMSVVGGLLVIPVGLAFPLLYAAIVAVGLFWAGVRLGFASSLDQQYERAGKAWSLVPVAAALVGAALWARGHGFPGGVPLSVEWSELFSGSQRVIDWLSPR